MAIKPNAQDWAIKEQIVEDQATGLTLQFAVVPESNAPIRLRIYGDDQVGSRELRFNDIGEEAGSGCHLYDTRCRGWLREV